VETILSLLHGQEPAAPAESARPPYLTYLVRSIIQHIVRSWNSTERSSSLNLFHRQVPPIVVPPDFDRTAALMRYQAKRRRKSLRAVVKADYSCRRDVALR
jgi:hypothetical protein